MPNGVLTVLLWCFGGSSTLDLQEPLELERNKCLEEYRVTLSATADQLQACKPNRIHGGGSCARGLIRRGERGRGKESEREKEGSG